MWAWFKAGGIMLVVFGFHFRPQTKARTCDQKLYDFGHYVLQLLYMRACDRN